MPRRNRPIARQRPLAVSAAYAGGLWLAGWALAAAVQLVMAGAQWRRLGLPQPAWMPWLALLPALAGACGFAAGWRVFGHGRRAAQPAHGCGAALAAGCLFPWLSGALLPLLAAWRSGMWPALAWCVLGSALMALPVARVTQDRKKGNP